MQRRHALALLAQLPVPAAAHSTGQGADGRVFTKVDSALGAFFIAVHPERAPVTVANYLAYVDAGQLDGGSVYRIVTPANQPPTTKHKIEVVQWGRGQRGEEAAPRPAIAHETTQQTGLRHLDGTVSMARTSPGSATAEFFICMGAQPELDFGGGRNPDGQGFAAFGQVVAGRDVVQALYAQGQAEQFLKMPIAVRSVRRVRADETPPR